MPPFVFRHYHTSPDNEQRHRKNRNRHKYHSESDPNKELKYENDSVYGDTVYNNESEYTARNYTPVNRKLYYDSHHHGNHQYHYGDHHHNDYQIQQRMSPRSESPVKYWQKPHQHFDLPELGNRRGLHSDPRYRHDKHTHCGCHACPQKSSKTLPTMHYDELRCPHCSAYAQPTQDEVLAYPWTAQSFRPNRRLLNTESHPSERFSAVTGTVAPGSTTYKPASTTLSNTKPSLARDYDGSETDMENLSLAAPSRLLFRSFNGLPRSDASVDGSYSKFSKRSFATKRQSPMSMIKEGIDDDDVKPTDSISNVSFPILRTKTKGLVRNYKPSPEIRAETDVNMANNRDMYYRLLNQSNPRPAKDTASQISRMLKGEYYDRRNGMKYTYDVNYAPRDVRAARVAKT